MGKATCRRTPRSIVKRVRDLIDGVYSEKAGKDAERLEQEALQRAQVEDMSEKDVAREIKRCLLYTSRCV